MRGNANIAAIASLATPRRRGFNQCLRMRGTGIVQYRRGKVDVLTAVGKEQRADCGTRSGVGKAHVDRGGGKIGAELGAADRDGGILRQDCGAREDRSRAGRQYLLVGVGYV